MYGTGISFGGFIVNPFKLVKLTRTFYSDYTHVLQLRLNTAQAIKLKYTARACALLYNKTLTIQTQHFDCGFLQPLQPLDLLSQIPKWERLPGMGFLERMPKTMIKLAIADCCRDVEEAFKDTLKFKLPMPLDGEYKHLEFLKGVTFNQINEEVFLPGWEHPYKYFLLKANPPSKEEIMGKIKKVWIIFKEGKWLVLVWSRSKIETGKKAAPSMLRASRRRLGEIQPLVYSDNHWIVAAHKKRTGEE